MSRVQSIIFLTWGHLCACYLSSHSAAQLDLAKMVAPLLYPSFPTLPLPLLLKFTIEVDVVAFNPSTLGETKIDPFQNCLSIHSEKPYSCCSETDWGLPSQACLVRTESSSFPLEMVRPSGWEPSHEVQSDTFQG